MYWYLSFLLFCGRVSWWILGLDNACVVAFNILGRIYQPTSTQAIIRKQQYWLQVSRSWLLGLSGCAWSLQILGWQLARQPQFLDKSKKNHWFRVCPTFFNVNIQILYLGAETQSPFKYNFNLSYLQVFQVYKATLEL